MGKTYKALDSQTDELQKIFKIFKETFTRELRGPWLWCYRKPWAPWREP